MGWLYPFEHDHGRPPRELAALLGGKGANLAEMTTVLGLPVPPGFTITTEACRAFRATGWPAGLDDEIEEAIAVLEGRMGRCFGDPADPLLVSVRSGAESSMPGMLDTVLNLGLTETGATGLGRVTDPGFAADARRRLVDLYSRVVGEPPPDDPREQLRGAIEAVFRSWDGARAKTYRAKEGIADDLGTAVNVQVMVFGNRDDRSGTGVAFTRDAATGEPTPYGDYLPRAQGEDVVAGSSAPLHLKEMAAQLPEAHVELLDILRRLEAHYRDICDTEFTVESGRLWMLQTRVGKRSPAAALRMAVDMVRQDGWHISEREAVARVRPEQLDQLLVSTFEVGAPDVLAVGLPASPGTATGAVYFDADRCVDAVDRGEQVVLVRAETSPEDVHGMQVAEGVLTSRGGLVSHAAVVARGWGIPAVVGAGDIEVGDDHLVARGRVVREGEVISIDGSTGAVVLGQAATETSTAPADLEVLLRWADDIAGVDSSTAARTPAERLRAARASMLRGT
jgi:pyruvate,orthophosphate dikinase